MVYKNFFLVFSFFILSLFFFSMQKPKQRKRKVDEWLNEDDSVISSNESIFPPVGLRIDDFCVDVSKLGLDFEFSLSFQFEGRKYSSPFHIGINQYRDFIKRYFVFRKIPFAEELQGSFSRQQVLEIHGEETERQWILDCITLMFKYISKKNKEYKRNTLDYFKYVLEHNDELDLSTLGGWLVFKAALIVVDSSFKYPMDGFVVDPILE